MSTANYGPCLAVVLATAFKEFGKPETPDDVRTMAAWVKCRMDDIRSGTPIRRPERDAPANDDAWSRY
jgi:hypothetical protein